MERLVKKLLKKIEQKGYQAYVVGGYVRDYLLNVKSFDIDICCNAPYNALQEIFKEAYVNKEYKTLKLKINQYNIDITPFREETIEQNKTIINYGSTLEKDALRRDFTINAIYMDRKGNIIDPVKGREDLKRKIIKTIGDTKIRLEEDNLRILRALRFKVQLNFELDDELAEFIENNKHLIRNISYYRKKEEIDKILELPQKLEALVCLKKMGVLQELEIDFDKLNNTNYLGMWAQLKYSDKYSFTKEEKTILEQLKKYSIIDSEVVYNLGLDLSYILADILNEPKEEVLNIYKSLPLNSIRDIKINYKDLHNLGYKDREISDIIRNIEKEIILGNIRNKKKDIVKFLEKNWR